MAVIETSGVIGSIRNSFLPALALDKGVPVLLLTLLRGHLLDPSFKIAVIWMHNTGHPFFN
ncbi:MULTISPECIES: hypothetical protein [Bifidobacterium]|jgi:hypothetical protein|uniref:hypothetical protein n=1 Tax=Bifidobacterium TaxID=1678 RepID=UPI000F4C0591|nr:MULTISPECIES: hypothetical protein [Bifidobacterium]MCH3975550.1 hypothetical protein [Bifidobacterium tibiigranuli]MCI1833631.1 hypothetical protein [Bifidobacterium tibiigranuli]